MPSGEQQVPWSAWKVIEGGRKGPGLMEDSKGLRIWNPQRRISCLGDGKNVQRNKIKLSYVWKCSVKSQSFDILRDNGSKWPTCFVHIYTAQNHLSHFSNKCVLP
jgi:hypothetical protein